MSYQKKRTASETALISPNKAKQQRKPVNVFATVIADSTVAIVDCTYPGRTGEPFTQPAREAVSSTEPNTLKDAGILCMQQS